MRGSLRRSQERSPRQCTIMSNAELADSESNDRRTTRAIPTNDTTDEYWMRQALDLAVRGQGRVEPNPMVGCVVVQDGREIGQGWHQRFGGPHAEVDALSGLAPEQVGRSEIYVTLEPCAHHGKTPPCLDLLLKLRPKRVIVAMLDPFPAVSGRGVAGLRSAGIEVSVGCLEAEARHLNAPYLKRLETGLPWVIAKWAMTLDGAIATEKGDSKWITGEIARQRAHELRSCVDAIVVGSETVLQDDPLLTARLPSGIEVPRVAMRIVIDRRLRTPLESQLVRTASAIPLCLVTTRQTLHAESAKANDLERLGVELLALQNDERLGGIGELLRHLGKLGATNVMVEGGGKLLGSFFDGAWVDQVDCFIAPRVLGSAQAARPVSGVGRPWISQTQQLLRVSTESCGMDIHVHGCLLRERSPSLRADSDAP
jgi:diaminohydroxyphosphoribosylaminopyrimidine deaminase/5-amino-6-(5-phosphoribosylamino)uracil reductase